MGRRLSVGRRIDYSRVEAAVSARPHDLLWTQAQRCADDTPDWVVPILGRGGPFVVRRAVRMPGRLPVGVRGGCRRERFAMTIDSAQVADICTPEQLSARIAQLAPARRRAIPALAVLGDMARTLDRTGLCWGLGGAVGYELATGEAVCHKASDIDVLLRMPREIARADARAVIDALAGLAVRCDIQMETPRGGVALADWAAGNTQVLVKSDQGPFLCPNPWSPAPLAADTALVG
ncbi:phosphoribosyl-dephospho-CoA transferase [Salinisphaera sp. T5B8]|uniref:malonate decarboxylase holo-ACP synthase n=1 Tax=Salinisphaera sp. T5B8 TaxID=1304154 RepID=UPI0033412E8A